MPRPPPILEYRAESQSDRRARHWLFVPGMIALLFLVLNILTAIAFFVVLYLFKGVSF
jgi:hypothetical protein